jgi:DICT domain-containing protein
MPTELYDRILGAVVTTLTALAIPKVKVYRELYADYRNEQDGALVVSYFAEYETVGDGDWAADDIGLPVLVQYFAGTLMSKDTADQTRELTIRGQVYDALAHRRLAGVPEVQTVVPEPRPVAEPDYPVSPTQKSVTLRLRSGILFRVMARRARAA